MVIQFEIIDGVGEVRNENHNIGKHNFGKANYAELGRYFENADWSRFEEANGMEGKWNMFLEIYNEGARKHVPKVKVIYSRKNDWFNIKCREARKKKEEPWGRWNRTKRINVWKLYKKEGNEYIRICREKILERIY